MSSVFVGHHVVLLASELKVVVFWQKLKAVGLSANELKAVGLLQTNLKPLVSLANELKAVGLLKRT